MRAVKGSLGHSSLREVWEIEDSWKDTHVGPVLVKRAVSEDPRWTRAVGDRLGDPQERNRRAVHRSMRGVM
jgi:hypothetical protein